MVHWPMGFIFHTTDYSQRSVSSSDRIEMLNFPSGRMVHVKTIVAKRNYVK